MVVPHLVARYWDFQRQRGAKLRPVFVLRAGEGHQQPKGYPLAWSVQRAYVDRCADKISNQGPTYVERLEP